MKIPRPISSQPIPETARKVFEGIMFDVYQWEQEVFDGSKAIFEKVKRPDTVVVFPVLPDGKILLINEEQPSKQKFISAPGGRIEKDEDVLTAAKRELLEETGYEANEFILWEAHQPVSKVEWAVYVLVAKGLKKVSEMNLDPGEKIDPYPVSFDEFMTIGSDPNFRGIDMLPKFLEAKLYPEKMEALRTLFRSN
ncbi:MAG: NUDIX hydrolase [Patescibacteria group bacterium]